MFGFSLILNMSGNIFRKKSVERILSDVANGFSDGEQGGSATHLKKELNVKDLTLMGIAAVVGAGIFSTIGTAAFNGGPGVSILFGLIPLALIIGIVIFFKRRDTMTLT